MAKRPKTKRPKTKRAKAPTRKKRTIKVKDDFVASVLVNEQTYSGAGATAFDALNAVVVPPGMFKTRIIVRLEHGKLFAEQLFFAVQLRRLLASRVSKEIWSKRLVAKLK